MATLTSARGRAARPATARLASLDAYRGLAVLFMLVDHVTLLTAVPDVFRLVPGRLAMPMFFLLAGYLATAPRWRHAWVGYAGIALPFFVPWVDSPNVLVLWAGGVAFLALIRYLGLPVWLLAAVGLAVAANGWAHAGGGHYDVFAMWGLLALGTMLPRSAFDWTRTIPGWIGASLALVGRHPIAWYLGHLTVLEVGRRVIGGA